MNLVYLLTAVGPRQLLPVLRLCLRMPDGGSGQALSLDLRRDFILDASRQPDAYACM
jgi:hypothetical protein